MVRQVIVRMCVAATLAGSIEGCAPLTVKASNDIDPRAVAMLRSGVVKIKCKMGIGTGFLHKSGLVLTGYHVVKDCIETPDSLSITDAQNNEVKVACANGKCAEGDEGDDVATLRPMPGLKGLPLPLLSADGVQIGAFVAIGGFPLGYDGQFPLVSAGWIAGVGIPPGHKVERIALDAALNRGGSGGPLFSAETLSVVGIAMGKFRVNKEPIGSLLAQISETPDKGMQLSFRSPAGITTTVSAIHVLAASIEWLHDENQLGFGYAISISTVKSFLKRQGVEP